MANMKRLIVPSIEEDGDQSEFSHASGRSVFWQSHLGKQLGII